MAEMFNDFFKDISAKINDSIPSTKKSPLDYLTNRNDKSFFISLTTPEEVEAIIISLNSGKSTGPYSIKSVQSTLSHLISTSVPRATFTRLLVEHGLFQYYS